MQNSHVLLHNLCYRKVAWGCSLYYFSEKNIVHLWRCVLDQNVGIEITNGRMTSVVMKGTELPTSATQGCTTTEDNQREGVFKFYQGDDDYVAKNTYLFEFPLSSIRALPKHVPKLELKVSIDEFGSLTASVTELNGTANSGSHTSPSKLGEVILFISIQVSK